MREHPILFSGPMVRAILDGRKVMTRRVVKPYPKDVLAEWPKSPSCICFEDVIADARYYAECGYCPYGKPGDRLWVRETFSESPDGVIYRATVTEHGITECDDFIKPWHPSIFMPRKFSRITLEITGVRVERLQEISVEDCINEGFATETPYSDLADLWDHINGAKYPWSSNPWVWVISFRRIA